MKVQYDGDHDEVDVPALSDVASVPRRLVRKGEVVDVPAKFGDQEERARGLLSQAGNWLPADAEAEVLVERMAAEARGEAIPNGQGANGPGGTGEDAGAGTSNASDSNDPGAGEPGGEE